MSSLTIILIANFTNYQSARTPLQLFLISLFVNRLHYEGIDREIFIFETGILQFLSFHHLERIYALNELQSKQKY